MPLTSGIIASDDVKARAAVDYKPKKVSSQTPAAAKDFIRLQNESDETRFKINPLLADQTGIAELERLSLEDLIERRALEKFKEVQEVAYKEAYALGQDDGKKEAFARHSEEIKESLSRVNEVGEHFRSLTKQLMSSNESQIIDLIYHIASQIAFEVIEHKEDRIKAVVQELAQTVHGDQVFSIRLAPEDLAHFQNLMQGEEAFEFLKSAKVVESPDLKPGGCVVETNYGLIDASLEERVKRAWDLLASKKPKLKDTFG